MSLKAKFWEAVAYVGALPDKRAKLVASQAALVGDLREGYLQRGEELDLLNETYDRMLSGLHAAAAALDAAQKAVAAAIPANPYADAIRGQAGYENLMATRYGDPDYFTGGTKGGMPTLHIDCRPARSKKAKGSTAHD